MKTYYLASPYSHDDPKIRKFRGEKAEAAFSYLASQGLVLYSPIASCWRLTNVPSGFDFWKVLDLEMINRLDALIVLELWGWEDSIGVIAELKYAREKGKEIFFCDPNTFFLTPEVNE